jgi:hypothetical protein
MNELTGKKDTSSTSLSFDDQRSLMTGSRSNGPTLAIGGAPPTTNPSSSSYDKNTSFNKSHEYVSTRLC